MVTPKNIWQTWKTHYPPKKLDGYAREWKRLHPEFSYYLLDDGELRDIVKDVVPQYLDEYDRFTHTIERVDFARYAIMYRYGGVYADLDTLPLKSINMWVEKNQIVLGCEPREHALNMYHRDRVVCNALMISPPGEKMWLDLMKYIISHYEPHFRPVDTTGPMAMTKFFESKDGAKYFSRIIITDPCVFYPLQNINVISKDCDVNGSYVIHMWNNTWVKPWYHDQLWLNARYWIYILLLLFIIIWIWCCLRTYT